jgi:hypothetical protein
MPFVKGFGGFRTYHFVQSLRKAGGTLCQTVQLQMKNKSQRKATMQVVTVIHHIAGNSIIITK